MLNVYLATELYDNTMYRKHKVYLVNRLEFLSDRKDGLDVVVTQFLNQMGDGGVVLSKDSSTWIETNTCMKKSSIQQPFQISDYVNKYGLTSVRNFDIK